MLTLLQAFHGNTVSVYVKQSGAPKGVASLLKASYWKRYQIDNFGPLNDEYTGTVHHVAAGDFDGTGVDAFAIACMGARKCFSFLLFQALADANAT